MVLVSLRVLAMRIAHNLIARFLGQVMMHLDGLGAPFEFRYDGGVCEKVDRNYDFGLRARFRLRTPARRFISAERCSGVMFAQEALLAALRIRLRSFFLTPFQRAWPAAFSLARESTTTISSFIAQITVAEFSADRQASLVLLTVRCAPC
jgi:hypothetical protein